jgi:hypothetical protein
VFQRSVITSILWFIEPACPVQVFDGSEAAFAWAREQLHAAGLASNRRG